ncbi:hypothetical protein [Fodinibius salsisoli]|uniref:Uncharacterized protein n=1 Tax=Fodinibius salsisoli TaxID=2820877 RepID=A0ABT3PQG1_9BACT|nr:hypothetical protein [Fodinibius salsisoli]MCW9708091.1 hypothetical protein [Fodinibius salsisoli]
MSSYKRNRSRKSWDIQKLKLRIQDALKAIEPVFLGEEGKDYDRDDMQLKCKAAHAYSQLASKHRKLLELEEIEERLSKLEEQHNT